MKEILIVAWVLLSTSAVHSQPATFSALKEDVGENEWKVAGYVCVSITNCAVQIIGNNGALVGCTSGCVGECKLCFAAGAIGTVCEKQSGKDCKFLPGAATFTCGTVRTGECRTGNPSTTWNHDINGCV